MRKHSVGVQRNPRRPKKEADKATLYIEEEVSDNDSDRRVVDVDEILVQAFKSQAAEFEHGQAAEQEAAELLLLNDCMQATDPFVCHDLLEAPVSKVRLQNISPKELAEPETRKASLVDYSSSEEDINGDAEKRRKPLQKLVEYSSTSQKGRNSSYEK
ncbi:hypothetical protein GOP47_0023936 [Adiantum capillus-veneris]|uniref:Uncharacterized protein n=1 Tax=Adiantum capillus-veneris TaxID=13818 RepID=A0A9D4U4H1_ADICA|nr:hypothetical protein GOP47_0023936 [Adiantum capillus-veneris]